jgi:hypothetical protein
VLVNRRGSPLPSAATWSSSSNGGMMNKSRKFMAFDLRLVPTFEAFDPVVVEVLSAAKEIAVVLETACGKSAITKLFHCTIYEITKTAYLLERSSNDIETAKRLL